MAGKRFRDANGDNFVFLLESRTPSERRGGTVALYAYGVVREAERERPLWHVRTIERGCRYREATAQLVDSLAVTDLDADGIAEVRWVELFDCAEVQRPLQFVGRMIEGEARYSVHALAGAAGLVGEPAVEPGPSRWPGGFRAALVAAVAAAAPAQVTRVLADLPAELPHDALAQQESVTYTTREIDRDRGVVLRISYPELRFVPASAAARLNRELARFAGDDGESYPADLVGSDDGNCSVGVATTQLVSVACSRMVDTRTRRAHAAGEGGAPAEPTRETWNLWLLPGLPPVDPREVLGEIDVGACAPLLAGGYFSFTDRGLEFATEATFDGPAPAGCDEDEAVPYSDMKPRTPRAQQFVREVGGEAASEGGTSGSTGTEE